MDEELIPTRVVKPVIKETYAILLDDNAPFIGEVVDVSELDKVVVIKNVKTEKELHYLLKEDELVFKTDNYEILDIERVIPFDLSILREDVEQLNKQLTDEILDGLDISFEEIKQSEKTYTKVEVREDLLSSLVYSFNAYDNLDKLYSLNHTVDSLLDLMDQLDDNTVYLYNIKRDKPLPKWLIPVVDNPIKVYEEEDEGLSSFFEIMESMNLPMDQQRQALLNSHRPTEPSLSDVGYYTNKIDTYFRDCLVNSTCVSTKGNYKYDMRHNKQDLMRIVDGDKSILHSKDSLNVVGLLYLPESQMKFMVPYENELFNLKEKTLLNSLTNLIPYSTLKDTPIVSKTYNSSQELSDLDQSIFYTLGQRYESSDDFMDVLSTISPKMKDLLELLSEQDKQKIMNYKDLKTLFIQYELDPYKLSKDDLEFVNKIISSNVDNYLSENPTLRKLTVDYTPPSLTHEQKIDLSLDLILSMTNIPMRNEYIQKFIKTYCREANKGESKLWYYNVFTGGELLCKHYDFLSMYHNDKSAFDSMITVFGKAPEDGVIHCKHCGEYLCNEDYSLFDGFSDEQPIVMREEMVSDINLLESFKESDILLVKQLATAIGVSIIDEDIKLILDIQTGISNDVLANIRYRSRDISTSDEHPRVKAFIKKHKKEKDRKKLILKDTKEFQKFLKDTNKMISIISLLLVTVQSAIPSYEVKKAKSLSFIEFNSQTVVYNPKYIDFCLHSFNSLCKLYKDQVLWMNYMIVESESKHYSVPSLKNQIMNTIQYLVSPQYPLIQDRLTNYKSFLVTSSNVYVNYEWPTFKPLRKSELYSTVNEVLLEKEPLYIKNYILDYNNYPVENISLIESIDLSAKKSIHESVNLDVSEIMVNKAFLLLFNLAVSNYGNKIQKVHSIDLHIERFLQTVSKKEQMIEVFKKNNWVSTERSGGVSYKSLRTKIIPEIIATYLKFETDLSPCFTHQKICNKFIHVNVNNYDLHMLKTKAKRFYKYKPFVVYPEAKYDSLNEDFKKKLFKRYCRDPNGEVIKRFINTDYLGKFLVHTNQGLEDSYLSVYEHTMRMDESNFKDIMLAVQCQLPRDLYIQPQTYTLDNYTSEIDVYKTDTMKRILEVIQDNQLFELDEDHVLLTVMKQLVETNAYSMKSSLQIGREVNKAYSQLNTDLFVEMCSEFMIQPEIEKKQMKRFESIFINTSTNININEEERNMLQGDGFRYKNMRSSDISKVFELFLSGGKLTNELCYQYINTIRSITSLLSEPNNEMRGISKLLKLSATNQTAITNYMIHNSRLLHQDIFRKTSKDRGFYKYQGNCPLFSALLDYLRPFMKSLDILRLMDNRIIRPSVSILLSKYVLMFIFYKIIEFHDKLKTEQSDIVSMVEEYYLKSENEFNIYNVVSLMNGFIMDLLINMFEIHYDSRWVVSNINLDELNQRLSKQKEKEKQQLIQKLDTMSDEKRASTVELQKIGVTSMYHQAMAANESRIIDEYSTIDEGYDEYDNKETVDAAIGLSTGELVEESVQRNRVAIDEGLGYYDENDFDEDGVMGDEMQELGSEDLLDNDFNV